MNRRELKRKLLARRKRIREQRERTGMLSSGSTLLNLGCTDDPFSAFPRGKYIWLVGDSTSGKTFLSLTCMAEAANDPAFDNYRFIHDDVEDGALMDFRKYFGSKMADRVERRSSEYAEDFYDALYDAAVDGRPFIWVLDSMDALDTKAAEKKYREQKRARARNIKETGSMGDGKAKMNSQQMRTVLKHLKKTGSILIIISQTRDNLGFTMSAEKKTVGGGRALKFYATFQLWSRVKGKLKATVKGKNVSNGIICQVDVKKNRWTGKDRRIEIPIYNSVGFDDTGSCVDYLLEWNHWKKVKASIKAPEFKLTATRDKLIAHIESNPKRRRRLQLIVGKVWKEVESACEVKRKSRYE